mgnify:CR=1 FL=1
MDDETFNLEIRKFLKNVGITSQREIEKKVRETLKNKTIEGNESLEVEVSLVIKKIKFRTYDRWHNKIKLIFYFVFNATFFFISAIAFAGFKPLGQELVQFIIV